MLRSELSDYHRRFFDNRPICEYCGEWINKSDSIEMVSIRYGRRIRHKFFHTKCMEEKNEYDSLLTTSRLGGY